MQSLSISHALHALHAPQALSRLRARLIGLSVGLSLLSMACHYEEPHAPLAPVMSELNFHTPLNTWSDQLTAIERVQTQLNQRGDSLKVREDGYEAIKRLEYLASQLPELADVFQLKSAHIFFSLGESKSAFILIRGLFKSVSEIQHAAANMLTEHATRCEHLEESLALLSKLPSREQVRRDQAWTRLKLSTQCHSPKLMQTARAQVARLTPRRLSERELLEIARQSSIAEVFSLYKVWESARLPELAARALTDLIELKDLSPDQLWEAQFNRARLKVDRIRRGFKEAAKTLYELRKASGEKSRRASLLLGKAFAKAKQPRRAQKVYKKLVRDWKFSEEAETARFNDAFLSYELGDYQEATRAFKDLCRHKGKVRALKRLKKRARNSKITRNAEWYYAWSLYQYRPERAAPFLEAQIGAGLPTSSEGRRAAYWTARALSKRDPDRAAQLRAQLLQGHWGDWYALLLRARDPALASEQRPWPQLPVLESPLRTPTPVRDAPVDVSADDVNAQLERFVRGSEVARALDMESLSQIYMGRARLEFKRRLGAIQDPRDPLLRWGDTLNFHHEMFSWTIARKAVKSAAPPELSDAAWWRLRYPYAYSDAVKQASARFRITAPLLLSFIYKESAFNSDAISPAYAMGLMQILEKTARALHPDAPPPALLDPAINIALGAEYLSKLSQRFHDQTPLIAAAYNAGPKNVIEWIKYSEAKKIRELDLFVEMIPFHEARGYVKRLTELSCTYALLYGQRAFNECARALPIRLNLDVEAGVDF